MTLQAIRCQLDLYGLTSYIDNNKIVFTYDRGPNILKDEVFCCRSNSLFKG